MYAIRSYYEIKKRTYDSYLKLILREGCIIGAMLVGRTQKAGLMTMLLKKKIVITSYSIHYTKLYDQLINQIFFLIIIHIF